jgi:predicted enzyme related to lactoylglutathione lyase
MASGSSLAIPRLFRVIVPVTNIDKAAKFYSDVLGFPGERVSPNRHYFDCGGTILACLEPRAGSAVIVNPQPIYFAVADLDEIYRRASQAGCQWLDERIEVQHWGERAFFAGDPFGNPIYFVDEKTRFTGTSSV